MSERGSFVTEFIYCKACLKKLALAFMFSNSFFDAIVIAGYPIIGGRIKGGYPNEEEIWFEFNAFEDPETWPCHPVRIAVHTESGGSWINVINPDGTVNTLAHAEWMPWKEGWKPACLDKP